jgi:hypothetical protein
MDTMTGKANTAAVAAAVLLCAAAAVAGPAATGTPVANGFEAFKALAGEWVAAEDGPMSKKGDVVARYATTAAGSAVVETVFPGTAHEMVTVYHADGPDVVLTHFCMEGNQPRMRARAARGPRYDFAYDGGTNIDRKRDRHMHSAWLELVGADEIRSEWTEHAEGKVVLVVQSHLVRKPR